MNRHQRRAQERRAAVVPDKAGAAAAAFAAALRQHEAGQLEEAARSYRRILEVDNFHVGAISNLSSIYHQAGRFEDAFKGFALALKIDPNSAIGHFNMGNVLQELGRLDVAKIAYREAIRIKPDLAEAHNALGMALLAQGNLIDGWAEREWRHRTHRLSRFARQFVQPIWGGQPALGKRLLVTAEQGFGDTIMFCRFADLARARGLEVIIETQPGVAKLISSVSGVAEVFEFGEKLPDFDFHIPLMSLPHALRIAVGEIPAPVPYFTPDAALVTAWGAQLKWLSGFKVGVVWRGNPAHPRDRQRSIAVEEFSRFVDVPDVSLVILQMDALPAEFETLGGHTRTIDVLLLDFSDTAAVIANLDLVISVDTAVCHLAGALGRPVWTLLDFAADWRWLRDRRDTPWYPTMRLYRQEKATDWSPVRDLVKFDLETLVRSRRAN